MLVAFDHLSEGGFHVAGQGLAIEEAGRAAVASQPLPDRLQPFGVQSKGDGKFFVALQVAGDEFLQIDCRQQARRHTSGKRTAAAREHG